MTTNISPYKSETGKKIIPKTDYLLPIVSIINVNSVGMLFPPETNLYVLVTLTTYESHITIS